MERTEHYYKSTIKILLLAVIFFAASIINLYIHSKLYIDEGVDRGFYISLFIISVSFLFYLLGSIYLAIVKGYSPWLGLIGFLPLIGPLIILGIRNKNYELNKNRKLLKLYSFSLTLILFPLLFFGTAQVLAIYQKVKNDRLQIISDNDVSGYIKTFSKEVYPFGLTGLDFYNHKILLSSNAGVLQFNGMKVEALFHWDAGVCEALSVDYAHNLYWMYIPDNYKIYNYDGNQWQSVPHPGLDANTRGDVLSGIKTFQDKQNYWIIYAGKIWRYDDIQKLFVPDDPPTNPIEKESYDKIKYATVIGDIRCYIYGGSLGYLESDKVFCFDNEWKEIGGAEKFKFDTRAIISTGEVAYIRTRSGKVLRLNRNQLSVIETPGFCNAIAINSKGELLGSFLKKGIYINQLGSWRKMYDYPEVEFDKEDSFVWMAEVNGGAVAFAINTFQSEIRDAWKIKPHVWISDKDELKEIIFY
jgi:hypothetical protein